MIGNCSLIARNIGIGSVLPHTDIRNLDLAARCNALEMLEKCRQREQGKLRRCKGEEK
jgi:hypothetical protein